MRLFEQIATQLYSSFRPHPRSVFNFVDNVTCHYVHEISSVDEQCEFVRNNGSCTYDGVIYNYVELTYCQLGHLRWLAIIVLLLILLMLFVSIGSLADDFLCPSLLTISKTFRLPDHIAGVTFLAFGNSAPDIFSSISGISQSKPDLIFASLYGAGIFTTTIVTGCVLLSGEFAIMKMVLRDIGFYVGACFMVWMFILFGKIKIAHSISLVGYYFVYIATLVIGRFLFMRFIGEEGGEEDIEGAVEDVPDGHRSISNSRTGSRAADMEHDIKSIRSIKSVVHDAGSMYDLNTPSRKHSILSRMSGMSTASNRKKIYSYENGIMLTRFYRSGSFKSPRKRSYSQENRHLAHHHAENTLNHLVKLHEADRKQGIVEDARYTETIEKEQAAAREAELAAVAKKLEASKSSKYKDEIKFTNNFGKPRYFQQLSTSSLLSTRSLVKMFSETKEFIVHISPVDILEWHQYRWYQKVIELVKALPYFIMTICIPCVDIESPNENWCRLLICINIICSPQMILYFYGVDGSINSFPLWALLLLISFAIALALFIFSERAKPPVYHRVFGFVGFVMSVVFINAIAEEVIAVLSTFGILFGLSDSILGLTVLAWGNSLGDFIANNSLARQGYPGIAIAACLGGPLLNMLLGVGLPYTILIIGENRSEVEVHYTNINTLLFATIMASLLTTIGFFLFFRFKSSKFHSAALISIYVCYVVMAVLLEFNVFG